MEEGNLLLLLLLWYCRRRESINDLAPPISQPYDADPYSHLCSFDFFINGRRRGYWILLLNDIPHLENLLEICVGHPGFSRVILRAFL